ncbi:hypothetical protein B5V02_18650 [Mesorhizobium kowhaii]|uniref:Uncharacterized protein n=1 Tax=Mesorhizobium kowhaii TaxID=1300272 RepID=A0A2W7C1Z2_9HYPH|nr:hypothetical protein B5V02_18650 [Mesorhizobium kowhaii]
MRFVQAGREVEVKERSHVGAEPHSSRLHDDIMLPLLAVQKGDAQGYLVLGLAVFGQPDVVLESRSVGCEHQRAEVRFENQVLAVAVGRPKLQGV